MSTILDRVRMSSKDGTIQFGETKIKIRKRAKIIENINLEQMLQDCIVGQQRTAKGKKFVFLCGDYVYKGPFSDAKYQNIQERSELLKQWNVENVLYPLHYRQNPQTGQKWVIYENLNRNFNLKTIQHSESFSFYRYRIISEGGLPKLSDFIKQNKQYFYQQYDTYSLVLSYVYLFILNTGDVGLSNTLIDDERAKIYIIDYDENRGLKLKEDLPEVFYFSKPPSAKIEWFQHTGMHYKTIIDDVNKIRNTAINLNINLKI
ncbi:MAG: hypothetical protein ACXWEW_09270, partial [Nitrososphaeraceae archaeon]